MDSVVVFHIFFFASGKLLRLSASVIFYVMKQYVHTHNINIRDKYMQKNSDRHKITIQSNGDIPKQT